MVVGVAVFLVVVVAVSSLLEGRGCLIESWLIPQDVQPPGLLTGVVDVMVFVIAVPSGACWDCA